MQLYQLSSLVCGPDDYFNHKNYFERLLARAHTHFKYDSKIVKNSEGCQKNFTFIYITVWTKFIGSDDYQEFEETMISKSWLD